MVIKFKCPECNQESETDAENISELCPQCGKTVEILGGIKKVNSMVKTVEEKKKELESVYVGFSRFFTKFMIVFVAILVLAAVCLTCAILAIVHFGNGIVTIPLCCGALVAGTVGLILYPKLRKRRKNVLASYNNQIRPVAEEIVNLMEQAKEETERLAQTACEGADEETMQGLRAEIKSLELEIKAMKGLTKEIKYKYKL